MNNNSLFDVQFTKVVEIWRLMAGWILRTFKTRDQENLLVLWRTFVHNLLDYCFQMLSSHRIKLIEEFQSLYRCYVSHTAVPKSQLPCLDSGPCISLAWYSSSHSSLMTMPRYLSEVHWAGDRADVFKKQIDVVLFKIPDLYQIRNPKNVSSVKIPSSTKLIA